MVAGWPGGQRQFPCQGSAISRTSQRIPPAVACETISPREGLGLAGIWRQAFWDAYLVKEADP